MAGLKGKWIVVKPWTEQVYIGVPEILFVHKETAKQVKASLLPADTSALYLRTIPKGAILRVIPAELIGPIRAAARDLADEYKQKRDGLFETYLNKMNSVADQFEGEPYEIDDK